MGKSPEDDMDIYLKPTFTIESDHGRVSQTARDLTEGCSGDEEKAVSLFYFVRDSIRYNFHMISVFIEDFRASRVLEWQKGYCVQKAVLLTALGRAAGIPTRMAFAKIKNHSIPAHVLQKLGTDSFPRHGYNQFFLNGKWISATATFDKELCKKNGLPTVEFDGKRDSILPDKDLKGGPYIEYLEKFSPREDLPFEWIVQRTSMVVGPDKRPSLKMNP